MKKLCSCALFMLLMLPLLSSVSAKSDTTLEAMLADTASFLQTSVKEPKSGSVGGEWAVIALARCGAKVPDGYFEAYYKNVEDEVKQKNGVLHERKYTEYSRLILALGVIGKDPTNVAGHDLTEPLENVKQTLKQGLNGPIWALIALDSGAYGSAELRDAYLQTILEREIQSGGWALAATSAVPEPDITAMALTALSRHTDRKDVSDAVERGLSVLSAMQLDDGGYSNYGEKNAESAAQVLVALSSLGIPYTDLRFVKNGKTLLDVLRLFYLPQNGFSHTHEPLLSNLMTTEQCLYALAAAKRHIDGQTALFTVFDTDGLPEKHPDVRRMPIGDGKTFSDIVGNDKAGAIEVLARRGVINGMTDTDFCPDGTMTRAQFATIVVRALGLPIDRSKIFEDVRTDDWFFSYVATAYRYGIVNGVSETSFLPNGTITFEQAAVMITRAAKLCGLSADAESFETLTEINSLTNADPVSEWAKSSVAFCCRNRIIAVNNGPIKPGEAVTRADIAWMLYRLLGKARLL